MNYLEIITGRKLKDNRTKTGKDYTNGSLGSVFNVVISTTKSTNSLIKVKVLKNFFLANYQTIYPISPEISCNNSLLFQYITIVRSVY